MRRIIASLLICLLLAGLIPEALAAVVSDDDVQTDGTITVVLEEGEACAARNMQRLRAAFESAQDGEPLTVVVASPGTYYVGDGSRAWRLRSDTTFDLNGAVLIRSGSQGNLIQNSDFDGDPSSIGGYDLSRNITVKNGTLDGAGNTGFTVNLCNFGHAAEVHLEKMHFKNGNSHLVEFTGCRNCTVTDCTFSGYCPGTNAAVEALQFDICDNDVSAKQWNGVYYSDSSVCRDITVDNCVFRDYPMGVGNHKGIKGNHNTGIIIRNSRFENTLPTSQTAIWAYDFDSSEISGNTVSGNFCTGIGVSGCRNTAVRNNRIKLAGTGIYVTAADSYVRGTEKDVRRTDPCSGVSVTGNTVAVTGSNVGVRVYSGSGVSAFSNNTVTASGDMAVTFSSKSKVTAVKGNTVKAAKGIGVKLATSAQIGEFSGNKVTAKQNAVEVNSSVSVSSIKNNPLITSTAGSGIYISNGVVKTVSGNTVKSCKGDGILLTSTGSTSAVDSNTVSGCGGYGIRINNARLNISFMYNKFSKNKAGAYKLNCKYTINLPTPALPTLKNTKKGVLITVNKPAGASRVRIFRKTGSGKWTKLTDTAAKTYLDKTAKNGVKYRYTVRCISSAGKYLSGYNTAGRAIACKR